MVEIRAVSSSKGIEEPREIVHDLVRVVRNFRQFARQEIEIVISIKLQLKEIARLLHNVLACTGRLNAQRVFILFFEFFYFVQKAALAEGEFLAQQFNKINLACQPVPADNHLTNQVHEVVKSIDIDSNKLLFQIR